MKKRIECKVTGRVQMVMYRDFACRKAKKLGLRGMVKNNDDGSVTVIAEGEEGTLVVYVKDLDQGPVLANVEDVKVMWLDVKEEFSQFTIVY